LYAKRGALAFAFKHVQRSAPNAAELLQMQQRYYEPLAGRFLSVDPVTTDANTGAMFNRYDYAMNNPYKYVDPDGRAPAYHGMSLSGFSSGGGGWSGSRESGGGPGLTPGPAGNGLSISLSTASNFAAGVGDTLSFGATAWARSQLEVGEVDQTSNAYNLGQGAGFGLSTATGAGAGLRIAGVAGKGLEFSHWIPSRWGGPRNLFNGNFVTTAQHALSDPYRYQFMTRMWKAANPMPSVLVQQWNRIPWFWRGIAAGGAYGGASIGGN
jgi:RHS repeat-associated protein